MINMRILYIILLLSMILTSCHTLHARDEAHEGKDALLRCEFEAAVYHFGLAYEVLDNHFEVKLGLALSELLNVVNAPEITDVLFKLGVTQSATGFCRQLLSSESDIDQETVPSLDTNGCISSSGVGISHVSWPHPCAVQSNCNIVDTISPELQWFEISQAIQQNRTSILLASDLFYEVALTLEEPYRLGGIGMVHSADLYFIASVLKFVIFFIDIVSQYDLLFSVKLSLDVSDCTLYAEAMNHRLGVSGGVSDASSGVDLLQQAMGCLNMAFVEAIHIRELSDASQDPCFPQQSLLKWHQVPYGVMDNIVALTSTFQSEPFVLREVVYPDVTLDLRALFSNLPFRSLDQDIVFCSPEGLKWDMRFYIDSLNQISTPDLLTPDISSFELHPDLGYRLSSGWLHWTPLDLF